MGFFEDLDQDEQIATLKKKIKKLERNFDGGEDSMSDILRETVGMNCEISLDSFENVEGVVEKVDEEWMRVSVTNKKGTIVKIIRIDNIENITIK